MLNVLPSKNIIVLNVTIIIVDYKILKKIYVYLAVFEFLLKREHKFWNIKNNYSNVYVINEK